MSLVNDMSIGRVMTACGCKECSLSRRVGAKFESPICRSTQITSSNLHIPLSSTLNILFSPFRSASFAPQNNFKVCAVHQTLMQAFGSNVYRGTGGAGGSATGSGSG